MAEHPTKETILRWFAKPRHGITDTWTIKGFERIADVVEPWLPQWMGLVLFFPLVFTVAGLAWTEYALRYLLTPQRVWNA